MTAKTVHYKNNYFLYKLFVSIILLSSALASCLAKQNDTDGFIVANKNSSYDYFVAGARLSINKDYFAAIKMYEKALAIDHNNVRALRAMTGNYLRILENNKTNSNYYKDQAIRCAEKLILLDKDTSDGYYYLAMLHFDNLEKCIFYLNRYIETPTNYTESLTTKSDGAKYYAYALIGYSYGLLKDYNNCITYLAKYITKCKNDPKWNMDVVKATAIIAASEKYLKYKEAYETSLRQAAKTPVENESRKAPAVPSVPTSNPKRQTGTPNTIPLARSRHVQTENDLLVLKNHMDRAQEELDRALQNRGKMLDILTG